MVGGEIVVHQAGTRTPLVRNRNPPWNGWKMVLVMCTIILYIVLSFVLLSSNKYLMHKDVFPFSVALTSLHMFFSWSTTMILYACFGSTLFKGMPAVKKNAGPMLMHLLPLSVCFAGSICFSNEAYRYCSVPFLQMCREFSVVLVYAVTLMLGLEKYSGRVLSVLCVIMLGCGATVHGEMIFSGKGLALQIMGQSCEVLKIVIQQKIMQGFKLDPLTMVMLMSPFCLVALTAGMYQIWTPEILLRLQAHWLILSLNCVNALALNVAVAAIINYSSGISLVLCGVTKDLGIALFASVVFNVAVERSQWVGFSIACSGVAVYAVIRSMPEVAQKHGVYKTLGFAAMLGFDPEPKRRAEVETV